MVGTDDDPLHYFCERVGLFQIGGERHVDRFGIVVPCVGFIILEESVFGIIQPASQIEQLGLLGWIEPVEL